AIKRRVYDVPSPRTCGLWGSTAGRAPTQENLRRWAQNTVEAQLGMASEKGRGAPQTLTPPMPHILSVAYPELDGRLRASQQPQ
ncbi:hypothetical protein NDU88_006751, partial [Pleurodeles waltl]